MNYELINQPNLEFSALEQVLINRGIQYNDIEHYLNVTEEDNLNPLLLNNIERAVSIFVKHLGDSNSHIHVQVDSDCDGYTSAALLLNYVYSILPSAVNRFSYSFHGSKAHGINLDLIPHGTTLVMVPDASSNDYEIHEQLYKQNIDVVVLDHHHADKVSEYACVVNNQLCDYPTKSLSGVGIVYKFCQCLDHTLGQDGFVDKFLDIVAIGLVGDMMSLLDFETHYLVQQGLKDLRNPFIKGMAEKNAYSIGSTISPVGVTFYIVPLVNAITRVGTIEEKTLLFESMLEYKAWEMVPSTKRGCAGQQETRLAQSLRTCTNVKNRQTRNQDIAVEQVKTIIEEENLLSHKLLLVRLREAAFDLGITGLIANKLMAEYQRPVALLVATETEGGLVWRGSARGYGKSNAISDFRKFCEETGLVEYAQGHGNAFGLSILDSNFDAFVEYTDDLLRDAVFSLSYKVDFIHTANSLKSQDVLSLGSYKELWGQDVEEPMLAIEHIQVTKDMVTLMSRDKNPTLKIQLSNGVACIKFRSSVEEYESLLASDSGCVTINLVARPEVNKYFNSVTPQLIIVDYEIVNKQEYYF